MGVSDKNFYADFGAAPKPPILPVPTLSTPAPSRDLQLAITLHRDRRFAEAAYRYRAVLDKESASLDAALGLAATLVELKKYQDAIALLEQAVADHPDAAAARTSLAIACDSAGRLEDAVPHFHASLALRPADQDTLLALSSTLHSLGRRDQVIPWLERAVAAEPRTLRLHGMLAAQLFGHGRIDEALAEMEHVLALDPKNVYAYTVLANMKTFTPGDPHLAVLEELVRESDTMPADARPGLLFALAKAYADVGRDEESFHHVLAANRMVRQWVDFDASKTAAQLEQLKSVFTPALMRAKAGLGHPSDRPIFIVGLMRSGTTLLEQILAGHPAIFGGGENDFFRASVRHVIGRYPEPVPSLGAAELHALAQTYLNLAQTAAGGVARIVDKMLSNDVFVGLIHLALPNARIIHCIRDPVDTCLSIFSINYGPIHPYSNDLYELGRYYRAERDMMAYWRKLLPERALLVVRYEDVVADLEGQARRVLDFCGLEWDPACLAFDKSSRPVWTASVAQIRRPLYSDSVGRWRPSREILRPLLEGLGEYAPADEGGA